MIHGSEIDKMPIYLFKIFWYNNPRFKQTFQKRWTLLHETVNLRIHDYFERGNKVKIIVNNEIIEAYEGECLSVVLFISNKKNLRTSPKLNEDRGMFCMMGSCQECVVLLNGKKVTSCNIFIEDGMEIKTGNLNEL